MLDAFGKGASDDIRAAKNELYGQMTWDPVSSQSLNVPPQISTPKPSPPPSPKLDAALSGGLDTNSAGAQPLTYSLLYNRNCTTLRPPLHSVLNSSIPV